LAVLALFAAMTRFEPSVLRASAMAGVGLLAAFAGRPAHGRRLLALAVAGLVLADPFLIHSLGFRLSVGASAGILALARPLAARLAGPRWLRDGLAVTAAAQIGVAPVALPAFGRLPLIAFPANLLAAPAAAALTLWGFGSGLAGGLLEPLVPGAPGALAVPSRVLSSYLAGVASGAARFPLAVGGKGLAALVAVSALGRLGWGVLRGCRPDRRAPLREGCPGPGRPGP
jgi:competence protein ComEC